MTPIGGRHVGSVNRLTRLFSRVVEERALVSVQNPVRLSPHSEPQPDLAILRLEGGEVPSAIPSSADVLLIIEVADTSLAYDRDVKLPLYAAAGIPEVWIIDLRADRLRVYRDPDAGEYRQTQILTRGAVIAPLAFPDLRLSVDELLG